jgi:hydroxyacylglutathione hydrolase
MQDIKRITLRRVNCYLIRNVSGYILIDTSWSSKRNELEKELCDSGCKPDNLKLIILTHGDFDHCGNAAYLRSKYNAKIAMHPGDSGMVKSGDMFQGRKKSNIVIKAVAKLLLKKSDRLEPDINLEDGYDLSRLGFNAKVIHLPGHSKGSIGILTNGGDLFCGDLLVNNGKPYINTIIDDTIEAESSLKKVQHLNINTVYPGHGKAFSMRDFQE